jgi:hypothetical protein
MEGLLVSSFVIVTADILVNFFFVTVGSKY